MTLSSFFRNDEGATAIEYGLIAALVAIVLIGTLGALGTSIGSKFTSIKTAVETAQ
jgi:pilus assembly protein Flp/PilA